jgi:hypothetical protein
VEHAGSCRGGKHSGGKRNGRGKERELRHAGLLSCKMKFEECEACDGAALRVRGLFLCIKGGDLLVLILTDEERFLR